MLKIESKTDGNLTQFWLSGVSADSGKKAYLGFKGEAGAWDNGFFIGLDFVKPATFKLFFDPAQHAKAKEKEWLAIGHVVAMECGYNSYPFPPAAFLPLLPPLPAYEWNLGKKYLYAPFLEQVAPKWLRDKGLLPYFQYSLLPVKNKEFLPESVFDYSDAGCMFSGGASGNQASRCAMVSFPIVLDLDPPYSWAMLKDWLQWSESLKEVTLEKGDVNKVDVAKREVFGYVKEEFEIVISNDQIMFLQVIGDAVVIQVAVTDEHWLLFCVGFTQGKAILLELDEEFISQRHHGTIRQFQRLFNRTHFEVSEKPRTYRGYIPNSLIPYLTSNPVITTAYSVFTVGVEAKTGKLVDLGKVAFEVSRRFSFRDEYFEELMLPKEKVTITPAGESEKELKALLDAYATMLNTKLPLKKRVVIGERLLPRPSPERMVGEKRKKFTIEDDLSDKQKRQRKDIFVFDQKISGNFNFF